MVYFFTINPKPVNAMDILKYDEAIEACRACASVCQQCISACLLESDVKSLVRCIELCRSCATISASAAEIFSCDSEFTQEMSSLCAEIARECAQECAKHPGLGHCQRCAEACRICTDLCLDIVNTLPVQPL